MPVLWKYDGELGIAYFCPHCKVFQCTGKGNCTKCKGKIDWKISRKYTGRTYWN